MLFPVPWYETETEIVMYAEPGYVMGFVLASLVEVFSLTDDDIRWFLERASTNVIIADENAVVYPVDLDSVVSFFKRRRALANEFDLWWTFYKEAQKVYEECNK